MVDCWTTVGLVAAIFLLIFLYLTRNNDYWAKRGIKFVKPVPVLGSFSQAVKAKKPMVEAFNDAYLELKPHGFGGVFEMLKPIMMITSPELIRDITVKSFDYFLDRRDAITSRDGDPLFSRSLVLLKGDEWRVMRTKLSPAFTGSKLRGLFPHISKCAEQFAKFLQERKDAKNKPIEFKSALTRMTNDMIASAAFGMDANAVQNPKEEFYQMSQNVANFGTLRTLSIMSFPKLMAKLGISFTPKKVTDYFKKIIKGTVEYRTKNNVSRQDMLQLLMAAQKGQLRKEAEEEVGTIGEDAADSNLHKIHMTAQKGDVARGIISDEDIAAQAFIFFFAGFETVSTLLSFLAYEMAVNPDIQDRLREEINEAFKQELTYDSVTNMKYLDNVVSEVLRKYPPNMTTDRTCVKNYKIPGTDKIIEAGTTLYIPIFPLHRDPEYFPNPDKFDPDRFSDENKGNIKPYTYIPFGSGPRNCIGMRLALLEVKLCLIYMLAACDLKVCAETTIPIKFARTVMFLPENGVTLIAAPRNDSPIKL